MEDRLLTGKSFERSRGVPPVKLGKIDLVRTLQREEGNFDCLSKPHAGYIVLIASHSV